VQAQRRIKGLGIAGRRVSVSRKVAYQIIMAVVWAALWESFDLIQLAAGFMIGTLLLGRFSRDPGDAKAVRQRAS